MLIKFISPKGEKSPQKPLVNELGLRHICFTVKHIDAIVEKLKKKGTEIFSEISAIRR